MIEFIGARELRNASLLEQSCYAVSDHGLKLGYIEYGYKAPKCNLDFLMIRMHQTPIETVNSIIWKRAACRAGWRGPRDS